MKFLSWLFFFLFTGTIVKANGSHPNNHILKIDSLPQNLTFGNKLRLLLDLRRLKPVSINGSRIVPYVGEEPYMINVSKIKGRRWWKLVDSLQLALLDFVFDKSVPRKKLLAFKANQKDEYSYPDTLIISLLPVDSIISKKHPELSRQRKGDLIISLTGWEGHVSMNEHDHNIYYDITVPKKEYSKKGMKELSKVLAALSYYWLLQNEDYKIWYVAVYFEKEKKRVWHPKRWYHYSGDNTDDLLIQ